MQMLAMILQYEPCYLIWRVNIPTENGITCVCFPANCIWYDFNDLSVVL